MQKNLIAIPIYNEEKNLFKVIDALFSQINIKCTEILAIDDGSSDNSLGILSNFPEIKLIRNVKNHGYGFSILRAFQYAQKRGFKYLLTMDADGQHLPFCIKDFFDIAGSADIISGSRYLIESKEPEAIIRERYNINMKITRILMEITEFNLTDSFCGMKLYTVDTLQNFNISDYNYAMPLQVIIQAWHKGLTWKEIPVPLLYLDTHRNFNNLYENSSARYDYYIETIKRELEKIDYEPNSDIWSAS
ncbi:MAG: glycosyltransferase family 2 protein [bacterium]|nr:glycosyltransferase family 2 protein [bacterium]